MITGLALIGALWVGYTLADIGITAIDLWKASNEG